MQILGRNSKTIESQQEAETLHAQTQSPRDNIEEATPCTSEPKMSHLGPGPKLGHEQSGS